MRRADGDTMSVISITSVSAASVCASSDSGLSLMAETMSGIKKEPFLLYVTFIVSLSPNPRIGFIRLPSHSSDLKNPPSLAPLRSLLDGTKQRASKLAKGVYRGDTPSADVEGPHHAPSTSSALRPLFADYSTKSP